MDKMSKSSSASNVKSLGKEDDDVVAVAKVAVEETYHMAKAGILTNHEMVKLTYVNNSYFGVEVLQKLKKMCKEGAYWGTVAGVYVGMEYGMGRVRGTRDWKNATLGGALTGALVSAASNNSRDKIVMDAITGGAIATAAEFLNYLT
ncbi:hypothetical protein RHMOL_Rhmol01G0309200 [Rhododendron molle]|uniref:Uncharacterized protein n=1 Tax=Rhododendron molle TaxID=49168 RepID=A0ACC0Q790_RHOML|nr:hypothetical protein RHMOL_Rhmol01G0309200 [Rhododendron molle]